MKKKFYHATPLRNLNSILSSGEIRKGCDGLVYLAESEQDALKFIAIRCFDEIVVLEIEVPDEQQVIETFDHSYSFFQCRAFAYPENISTNCIKAANGYSPQVKIVI